MNEKNENNQSLSNGETLLCQPPMPVRRMKSQNFFASFDLSSDCLKVFCMAVLYSMAAVASEFSSWVREASIS